MLQHALHALTFPDVCVGVMDRSETVGGSLTQLLYALKLLWDAAAASAGPFTILSGGDDQQAAGDGSSGALALDCLHPAQEDLPDYPEVESCTWRRQAILPATNAPPPPHPAATATSLSIAAFSPLQDSFCCILALSDLTSSCWCLCTGVG